MNFLLQSILNPKNDQSDLSSRIIKIGQPFSLVDHMGPMGSDAWRNSWENYRAGIVTPTDASFLWKNIDAVIDDIGNDVYEKISRYIDNISNIDLCGIKELYSICQYTDYSDKISVLQFDYPSEIKELLDVLSINKNLLLSTNKVLTEECRTGILDSLSSAAPSLSSDDPRESWASPEPLIYFSISNSSTIPGTYYSDTSRPGTVLFDTPNSDVKIEIASLYSDDGLIPLAVAYPNITAQADDTSKILAVSYGTEALTQWFNGDISGASTTAEWFDGATIASTSTGILYPDIQNVIFIKAPENYKLDQFDILVNPQNYELSDYIDASLESDIALYKNPQTIKYLAVKNYVPGEVIKPLYVITEFNSLPNSVDQFNIYKVDDFIKPVYPKKNLFPIPLFKSTSITTAKVQSLANAYFIPNPAYTNGYKVIDTSIDSPTIYNIADVQFKTFDNRFNTSYYIPSSITISDSKSYLDGIYSLQSDILDTSLNYISWINPADATLSINRQAQYALPYELDDVSGIQLKTGIFIPGISISTIPTFNMTALSGIVLAGNTNIQVQDGILQLTETTDPDLSSTIYQADLINQSISSIDTSVTTQLNVQLSYIKTNLSDDLGSFKITFTVTDPTNDANTQRIYWQTEPLYRIDDQIPPATSSVWVNTSYSTGAASQIDYVITLEQFQLLTFYRQPQQYQWIIKSLTNPDIETVSMTPQQASLDTVIKTTVPAALAVNGVIASTANNNSSSSRFTDPALSYSALLSVWDSSQYTINRKTLTTDEYKAYVKNIFKKVLLTICRMPYADDPNTLIYVNKYNDFNGEALFSYELKYDSESEKQTIVDAKLNNNVKLTFNEQEAYENIVLGKTRIEDYTLGERNVIAYEKVRQDAPRVEGVNLSRFYKARELKVKEYFKFLLTFNSYINQDNLNDNFKEYDIDTNYFNITDEQVLVATVYKTGEDGKPVLDEHGNPMLDLDLIDNMAKSLSDICVDIAFLRDQLKTRVTKLYMVGTWNLIRNYIVEYLFNTIYPAIDALSAFNDTNFEVNLLEYTDGTEYFNIKNDGTYSDDERGTLNPRYWESTETRYSTADNLTDSDISAFYFKTLGLKLVDDNGNPVESDTALKDFLSVIYQAGAVKDTTADYYNANTTEIAEDLAKYSGNDYGKYPYYNYKNTVHPSYQLHQYIYNFAKFVYNKFAVSNLFLTAEAMQAKEIQNNIESFIDNYGNIINKWVAGRYDFTGYNSDYENFNAIADNQYIRVDGPFNMYALNAYLNAPTAQDGFEAILPYYISANVEPEDISAAATILANDEIREKISELSSAVIYKYATDAYNSSITLYKQADDKNLEGQLWFRPLNHPISVPMFIFGKSGGEYTLSSINYIKETPGQETDFIDEIAKTFESNGQGVKILDKIYDFDINVDNNYVSFVAKRPLPQTNSEVALDPKLIDLTSPELSSWNYANAFASFCKLDRVYNSVKYSYEYQLRADSANLIERSAAGGPVSNSKVLANALATVTADDEAIYCVYYTYPYTAASQTDNPSLPVTLTSTGTSQYFTEILVERYDYGTGNRSTKVLNAKLNYPLTTEFINVNRGSYIKLPNAFINKVDEKLSLTFECKDSDAYNQYLVNATGVKSSKSIKTADQLNAAIRFIDLNDTLTEFNIALLNKTFVSIDFNTNILDKTYTTRYFNKQSDNQYTPLYPAQFGRSNWWEASFADEPSAYFQVIANPMEQDIPLLVFEQSEELSGAPGLQSDKKFYQLSAYHAVAVANSGVQDWNAYRSYTTIAFDGTTSSGLYPLVAYDYQIDELSAFANTLKDYEQLSGSDSRAENLTNLIQAYNNPLGFSLVYDKAGSVGQELSSYTWLMPEHYYLGQSEQNEYIPPAYELSDYTLSSNSGESEYFKNFAILSPEEGYFLGISYLIGDNDVHDGEYYPITARSHVKFYDRGSSISGQKESILFDMTNADFSQGSTGSSQPSEYIQDITLVKTIDQGTEKIDVSTTYTIHLIEFDSTDLYKIKFIISKKV